MGFVLFRPATSPWPARVLQPAPRIQSLGRRGGGSHDASLERRSSRGVQVHCTLVSHGFRILAEIETLVREGERFTDLKILKIGRSVGSSSLLSIYQPSASMYLLIYLFIYSSICSSIYQSISQYIYLTIHLSIHPSLHSSI